MGHKLEPITASAVFSTAATVVFYDLAIVQYKERMKKGGYYVP
jgi:hypothetical protein